MRAAGGRGAGRIPATGMAEPDPAPASSRRPTPGHRFQYLAYRTLLGVLRVIPERWALGLGAGLGWFAGVVLGIRRGVVRRHLRQAFPTREAGWRRRTLGASFRHLGRESVATFLMGRMDRDEILRRTEVEGLEAMEAALEEEKGVILVTGHFGNWEMGGAALAAREIPLDVVAQRQRNPLFDADITRTREKLGMRVVPRDKAPRQVLRALRMGRVVALVADQNARRSELFVDFFGKKAATARGAAIFALRTGSPIFLGGCRRLDGPIARYGVTLSRVEFTPTGDQEEDVLRLTETHTRYLERVIRSSPEQYFWQHRRWKTRPPEESER